jgi:signal transduction histidine kinase
MRPVTTPILTLFFVLQLAFSGSYAQQRPIDSLIQLAKESLIENKYEKAIALYQQCLKELEGKNDWLNIGNSYIGLGIAYDESGNYQEGIRNYFLALHAYEKDNNVKKQAGTLKNIGNMYRILKNFDKAASFFDQAMLKYASIKDSVGISGVLNDRGIMYMDQDSNVKAIAIFKKVIYEYGDYVKKDVKAYAQNNLAITYSKLGAYKTAQGFYDTSLILMKQVGKQYGIALILSNIGDLYNKWGDYPKAIQYNKQAMEIAERLKSNDLLLSIYENFSIAYNQLNDYKQAYAYQKKQMEIKDTIYKEESARSYAEMETKYQNEKKQKEILLLQQRNTINSIALASQQRTKYFLLVVLVLILLVTLLLLRSYSIKRKANNKLNILNKKLNEANNSKTKLLSIISHDLRSPVSNLFSFLQLQKRNPERLSPEEKEKYDKQISQSAENLLEAMEDLLIWSKSQMDKFTLTTEKIYLSDFLDEIISLNQTAASNKKIQISKDCPPELFVFSDPNFLKVVIRNLISNAIKFTPVNGIIHVAAMKIKEVVLLQVKDNGLGITESDLKNIFEWNSIRSDSSGLGLKLVKEFTEKLNGTIDVHSELGKSTEFVLSFPQEGKI